MNTIEYPNYKLKLFIAGITPGSIRAIENVKDLCNSYLAGKYDLEVIDIYQQRHMIKEMNIIAVPTLIRILPEPERRIIGDMTDKKEIIAVMDFRKKPH